MKKVEEKKGKWKRTGVVLLQILVVVLVLYLVFHKHYREIYYNISQIGGEGILVMLLLAMGYLCLEVAAHYIIIKKRLPEFQIRQGIRLVSVGIMGKVVTASVGIIPLQSYYLSRRGLMPGKSVGSIIFIYIVNKCAVLTVTVCLILGKGQVLFQELPYLLLAVLISLFISFVIIALLIVVCLWKNMNHLIDLIFEKLPDTEVWQNRKNKIETNVSALYEEAQFLCKDKITLGKAFLVQCMKVFLMCMIPYFCLGLFHIPAKSALEMAMLTALSLLLAGICPNVGGLGPVEVTFLFFFSQYISGSQAASILVLYRLITYFIPFLVSVPIAGRILRMEKKNRENNRKLREKRIDRESSL